MERCRRAFSSLTAYATGAGLCIFVVLAALLTGSPPAIALPKASGSNCGSGWVNNEGALDCFILGEDDSNNGVPNPHYVACTSDGEIFCCVNTKSGAQICESQTGAARANVEQQVRAILESQAAVLANMARISKRLDDLEGELPKPGKN
jgi:hypothetical protein